MMPTEKISNNGLIGWSEAIIRRFQEKFCYTAVSEF